MHDAPEGLEYGTDNYKYKKADKLEPKLEKGKEDLEKKSRSDDRDQFIHHEHDRAGLERMLGKGSHDPYYGKK